MSNKKIAQSKKSILLDIDGMRCGSCVQAVEKILKNHPNIKDTILDKRNSRFNLVYLYLLMRQIKKYKFIKIFDLQNSSRTSFYKKILFPNSDFNIWSS